MVIGVHSVFILRNRQKEQSVQASEVPDSFLARFGSTACLGRADPAGLPEKSRARMPQESVQNANQYISH